MAALIPPHPRSLSSLPVIIITIMRCDLKQHFQTPQTNPPSPLPILCCRQYTKKAFSLFVAHICMGNGSRSGMHVCLPGQVVLVNNISFSAGPNRVAKSLLHLLRWPLCLHEKVGCCMTNDVTIIIFAPFFSPHTHTHTNQRMRMRMSHHAIASDPFASCPLALSPLSSSLRSAKMVSNDIFGTMGK